jgi:chromosomal replication initiator protein
MARQVILTSDKAPVDMQDIEQRLLSRFKWGYQLNYTNRIMKLEFLYLKTFCIAMALKFQKKLLYVARNIKSNVRELEGAISLIAQSSFNKKKLRLNWQKCGRKIREECKTKFLSITFKKQFDYFQLDLEILQSKN